MTGIAVYMEGGGDSAASKGQVRQAMDGFLAALKESARRKGWRWKVVPCGGRVAAKNAFLHALEHEKSAHVFLLVDAEGPVTEPPLKHLAARDGWVLKGVDESSVHLMVQVIETWIVADAEALEAFYGRGFHTKSLPRTTNLEGVAKESIATALKLATKGTTKGAYHKIHHATVLSQVRADRVRARCPVHCERFFRELGELLA